MSLDEITVDEITADWESHHVEGYARAAQERGMDAYFKAPLISQITNSLWTGGCRQGVILPPQINYVVSLYPWEQYDIKNGAQRIEVTMYDSAEIPDEGLLYGLAELVSDLGRHGQVLVHCQAGLNRSGLVGALSLVVNGFQPEGAIALLRDKRSPLVLCNESFEKWLLEQA